MLQNIASRLEPATAAQETTMGAWAELVWSIQAQNGTAVAAAAVQGLPWDQISQQLPGGCFMCLCVNAWPEASVRVMPSRRLCRLHRNEHVGKIDRCLAADGESCM